MQKRYRLLQHTVDAGIAARGQTLGEAYANVAFAMFAIITDLRKVRLEYLSSIAVRAGNMASLAEEASGAYKDISEVIEVAHGSGLFGMVARTLPWGVIKG